MTRSLPYPMNDPKDFSMLTAPKLHIGSNVVVWDEDEGGEWVQARVVAAEFNRYQKTWSYDAVVEMVDASNIGKETTDATIIIKDWYYFGEHELKNLWTTGLYVVIKE